MKHYVNLQFRPGTDHDNILQSVKNALEQAYGQIEGFLKYELLKATDWSEENPKLLLVLEFANSTSLKTYLEHHLHTTLLNTVKPYLADKAIFDGLI